MGQKDLRQSDYFDSNIRFADAYNGILFHGQTMIKPEELEECDSVFTQLFPNHKGQKVICDKVKKWKGQHLAILPLESQSQVDYRMVLRVMLEEVMAYEKQRKNSLVALKSAGKKLKKGSEFLSGMKKEQKFIPVIPLILYLGKDSKWDGATTLHEILEIDDELKPFVNNYKLNFYDYHNETDFSKFKTENKLLFKVLANRDNKEKIEQIFENECDNYSIDSDTAKALVEMADLTIDIENIKIEQNGKVEYKMCKAIDEIKQNARNDGYKSGMDDGYKSGMDAGYIAGVKMSVKSLMETSNLTLEQALEKLKINDELRVQFYS